MNTKRVGWFLSWIVSWGIAAWLGWTLYGPNAPMVPGKVPASFILMTWGIATVTVLAFLLVHGARSLYKTLEE